MQSQLQSDKVHTQGSDFFWEESAVLWTGLTPYDHDEASTATRIEIAAMAKKLICTDSS